jgi:hypothetical protein
LNHSFHQRAITRGVFGEFSKVEEEFYEAKDALEQKNNILLIVELCDLLGAIMGYMDRSWPEIGFEGLMTMSKLINFERERQNADTASGNPAGEV